MVILVDIDGILTHETKKTPYSKRTPNKSNCQIVRDLVFANHRVVLFTSRHKGDRKITIEWLKKHSIPYHKLIMGKPRCDLFWDDKSVTSISYLKTLAR